MPLPEILNVKQEFDSVDSEENYKMHFKKRLELQQHLELIYSRLQTTQVWLSSMENNEGAELEYAIRKTVQTSGKAYEHKLMI